ncbi:MAG: TlyA family RNA methyltransferase [Acidimicrobiia bacterium]
MRRRLDTELVRRGLVSSRSEGVEAIAAGRVTVGGAPAPKPARLVAAGEPIELVGRRRFVSRGGEKLEAALETFAIDVTDAVCLDAGASTGGFTDCLLQRGARAVYALDVGHGQLDWGVRRDDRVVVLERTDIRAVPPDVVGPCDVVTADLAFISLRSVLDHLADAGTQGVDVVLLVKPQFEVGRARVGRGGIVRDPALHLSALTGVADACPAAGLVPVGVMRSPLRGGDGNVEFLLHARRSGEHIDPAVLEAVACVE